MLTWNVGVHTIAYIIKNVICETTYIKCFVSTNKSIRFLSIFNTMALKKIEKKGSLQNLKCD